MKLPYFYQQMVGFFIVIVTVLYISSVSFFHFTKTALQQSTEDDLFTYAETVVENIFLYQTIDREQELLNKFNISLYIADSQGNITYPVNAETIGVKIIPEEMEQLQQGVHITSIGEYETDNGELEELMLVYVPFFVEETDAFGGFVAAATPISMVNSEIETLTIQLLRAFLIATIIAVIMSAFLARYQVNRINSLRTAAHTVIEGDYGIRVHHKERDELDALTKDFNQMVQALDVSERELKRQEERRKTFMQDAAHEMRTPLTTINGLLEGLEHNVIDEQHRMRSVELMRKETTRLIRLVNENLDYENIQANQIKLHRTTVWLHRVFSDIRYQMQPLAEDSNNTLDIADMGELTVYADNDRLKQILVNLIKNAIQFTDNGHIYVTAECLGDVTTIKIQDTGMGMTDEQLSNIWDRYYKADASRRNTKYGESGLGLAIVQQLVQLHEAKITVQSIEEEGTTFTLFFPAAASGT